MVEVILSGDAEPQWVVLSQHHGGTRRAWTATQVEDGTHPAVYVARGPHANYFVGDEAYPNSKDVGNTHVAILDRTGAAWRVIPEVIVIPTRAEVEADPEAWPGAEWLSYRGRWGEGAIQGDFAGPLGPADKGALWEQPVGWGLEQPLDTDLWYQNRLRVEVIGAAAEETRVHLRSADGGVLPAAEELGSLAILHRDPLTGTVASIVVPAGTRADVVATWPDAAGGQVTRFRFSEIQFGESGIARLELGPGGYAVLVVDYGVLEGASLVLTPTEAQTLQAMWDAPDVVWIGTMLPAREIGRGLLLALLASVIPTLLYVGVLYWADRYEKEPKRLLASAFVWGAVPAVVLALLAEVFFRLPLDLIGSGALEAARLGIVALVLQEAAKSIVVLLIAWRYRLEFDDTLDGVTYGAMTGFGFAMTGNLINYLGRFVSWGFDGFSTIALAEGVVHALNQAFYTAIFGAGLGYARLVRARWARYAVPLGAFVLAASIHVTHHLLARIVLGLGIITVLASGLGVVAVGVIVTWSLARQRRCLRVELAGEIPEHLYRTLTIAGARGRAQWQALWSGGPRAWWRTRQLHQTCAELAIKKTQIRLRPDDPTTRSEIERLRRQIGDLA